jgi:hypothetical protein
VYYLLILAIGIERLADALLLTVRIRVENAALGYA